MGTLDLVAMCVLVGRAAIVGYACAVSCCCAVLVASLVLVAYTRAKRVTVPALPPIAVTGLLVYIACYLVHLDEAIAFTRSNMIYF
jgi:hypothetical protein